MIQVGGGNRSQNFSRMTRGADGIQISLRELNSHFVCVLCFGYFVDATTITECMHTFCKSCIVNFLSTNHHCPHCDTLLSRTRTLNSLRPDRIMQALVYKTIPGLFQTEMRRRINFYRSQPDEQLILSDFKSDVEELQNYVFSPEDSISLIIKYSSSTTSAKTEDSSNETKLENNCGGVDKSNYFRYFRCPATVPVYVLKVLLKIKHHIPDSLRVELLYGEERLLDSWTLMEIAYIFRWPRETPMELAFQIFATRKVKKKNLVIKKKLITPKSPTGFDPKKRPRTDREKFNMSPESDEPIKKVPKLIVSPALSSPQEHHQRPPTPPETPEQIAHDDSSNNTMVQDIITNFVLTKKSTSQQLEKKKDKLPIPVNSSKSTPNSSVLFNKISRHSVEDENDSEASLEVDFSHNISTEKEDEDTIPVEGIKNVKGNDQNSAKALDSIKCSNKQDKCIRKENGLSKEKDCTTANDVKSKPKTKCDKRFKKSDHLNVKNNTINDMGVLDFSYHARTVRAKRIDDINNTSPSSSPSAENDGADYKQEMSVASLSNGLSNGNGLDFKNNRLMHNKMATAPQSSLAKLPLDWPRPPLLPNPAVGSHPTTAFRDLVTLSHAAVQLQIAMAHAQAQAQVHVQAQKLQDNVLNKLKASESLSFINGSGDTLTISPIQGTQGKQKAIGNKSPKNGAKLISRNKSTGVMKSYTKVQSQLTRKVNVAKNNNSDINQHLQKQRLPACMPSKSSLSSAFSPNKLKQTKVPAKINSAQKLKTSNYPSNKLLTEAKNVTMSDLKSTNNIKTIIPKSALSALKIPLVNLTPCKTGTNIKIEKDKKIEGIAKGDEAFKITNQKLIECLRQQHHNNKLKNSTSPKSNSLENYLSPIKSPDKVASTSESIELEKTVQSVLADNTTITSVEKTVGEEISTTITEAKTPPNTELFKTIAKSNNSVTQPESSLGTKPTNISPFAPTSFNSSLRTTNTCVRQIPNPSRLHQQSVNRLAVGSNRPFNTGKRPFNTSTGDRLESLTRTLHEKVAASAGIVSSLAR